MPRPGADALYATHIRNEAAGLFEALDEALTAVRASGEGGRLQVSHLKCGSRSVWGRADEAVGVLEAAREEGVDVAADQYPYTAAATTLAIVLPPALLGLGVEECVAALGDQEVRFRVRDEIARGSSGWENVAADPGWSGIRISHAASHPDWAGRSLAELGEALGAEPANLAFDALMDDRLDVSVVIDCMSEADVETIMAVPWIAVCTDAEGRRPGHPILDAGRPHPRTYGSTARVLGTYVRERGTLTLETAVAKLTSVPAARLGCATAGPPGGRVRGPGRVRSGHGRRRGDLPRARPPPERHRARDRQRPAGGPRGSGDRATTRASPASGRVTRSTPGATEEPAIARLPGGPVPYTLRRSPRARTLRVVIHPERGVVVTVPSAGRRGWSDPERHVTAFLAEREPWLRRHLARQSDAREQLAARGGLEDGALIRYRGDLHRLRFEAARPRIRRSSVERSAGDGEDQLVVRRAAARPTVHAASSRRGSGPGADRIERVIARYAEGFDVGPTVVTIRDPRSRWGSASRGGRLSFSWRLILAPPEALETVVIHELAHLRIFGHGPALLGARGRTASRPRDVAPLAARPRAGAPRRPRSVEQRGRLLVVGDDRRAGPAQRLDVELVGRAVGEDLPHRDREIQVHVLGQADERVPDRRQQRARLVTEDRPEAGRARGSAPSPSPAPGRRSSASRATSIDSTIGGSSTTRRRRFSSAVPRSVASSTPQRVRRSRETCAHIGPTSMPKPVQTPGGTRRWIGAAWAGNGCRTRLSSGMIDDATSGHGPLGIEGDERLERAPGDDRVDRAAERHDLPLTTTATGRVLARASRPPLRLGGRRLLGLGRLHARHRDAGPLAGGAIPDFTRAARADHATASGRPSRYPCPNRMPRSTRMFASSSVSTPSAMSSEPVLAAK